MEVILREDIYVRNTQVIRVIITLGAFNERHFIVLLTKRGYRMITHSSLHNLLVRTWYEYI